MSLIDFFRRIDAPSAHLGASAEDIAAAEIRLGGVLPPGLRRWFLEADGFEGEAKSNFWRFKSLRRLDTVAEVFPTREN